MVSILKNFVKAVFEKKFSNKAKFVVKSKYTKKLSKIRDIIAKFVALLKELFLENNPYIKQAIASIERLTSGTNKIFIKLFSISYLIVGYN